MALYPAGDVTDHLWEAENEYPKMLEDAEREGHKSAEWAFTYGVAAEKRHAKLYSEELENFEDMKNQEFPYFVCTSFIICFVTSFLLRFI